VGLNLEDKKAVVAEVSARVATAQTIALAEYRGIEVGHLTALRKKARESGVYLRVLKNTLVRRAVAGTPFAELADQMVGPLIYSLSKDPVSAAKVLHDLQNQRQAGHQGWFLCRQGAGQGRRTSPGFHPQPRRTARQTAGCHAGPRLRLCRCRGRPGQAARRSRSLTGVHPSLLQN